MDEPRTFSYERPEEIDKPKAIEQLSRSEFSNAHVQIVREDGANNLHSHTGSEGFWMILEGTARFYTEGDEVLGTFGKYEGVHIPTNFPYWFESAGDEYLEILHVTAYDQEVEDNIRIDHEEYWDDDEGYSGGKQMKEEGIPNERKTEESRAE